MKLIALKDFARVQDLSEIDVKDKKHERHIHKGSRFEIGTAKELKELNKRDQVLVAQLIVSGSVGRADDPKVVAAVEEECEIDAKREENTRKLDANASNANLVSLLTEKLSGKTHAPAK